MNLHRYIIAVLAFSLSLLSARAASESTIVTSKQERNLINEGNKLYGQQRFAEAEVLYRKALEVKPTSEFAAYNLATSLLRQSGTKDLNKGNNPLSEAQSILTGLLDAAKSDLIVEKASYNLGNIAFNNGDFKSSIEFYKNALRKNSGNENARQNLRLAQKKLQEQQNQQNQNQDQNKQNQDKQQEQQKNQDKQKQDNEQNQQQDKQQNDKDKEKKQPQEQTGISDANAEKILKAMENEEAATRKRVEAQRKKGGQANRRQPVKPW